MKTNAEQDGINGIYSPTAIKGNYSVALLKTHKYITYTNLQYITLQIQT